MGFHLCRRNQYPVQGSSEQRREPELCDLIDLASSSESEGAMKSLSSEDAVECEPE